LAPLQLLLGQTVKGGDLATIVEGRLVCGPLNEGKLDDDKYRHVPHLNEHSKSPTYVCTKIGGGEAGDGERFGMCRMKGTGEVRATLWGSQEQMQKEGAHLGTSARETPMHS